MREGRTRPPQGAGYTADDATNDCRVTPAFSESLGRPRIFFLGFFWNRKKEKARCRWDETSSLVFGVSVVVDTFLFQPLEGSFSDAAIWMQKFRGQFMTLPVNPSGAWNPDSPPSKLGPAT